MYIGLNLFPSSTFARASDIFTSVDYDIARIVVPCWLRLAGPSWLSLTVFVGDLQPAGFAEKQSAPSVIDGRIAPAAGRPGDQWKAPIVQAAQRSAD